MSEFDDSPISTQYDRPSRPMISRGWVAALCLSLCVCLGCSHNIALQEHSVAATTRPSLPLVSFTGNDSRVHRAKTLRIENAADWKAVWLEHLGQRNDTIYRAAFEVDFSRSCVIAIFKGDTFNTCGFTVPSVEETADSIVLRYQGIYFQTFGDYPNGGAEHVVPFVFVVIPKSQKTVVIEFDVNEYIGHPPIWKEVERLPYAAAK